MLEAEKLLTVTSRTASLPFAELESFVSPMKLKRVRRNCLGDTYILETILVSSHSR